MIGSRCFLSKPTKIFSHQNLEKTEWKIIFFLIDKNDHVDILQVAFIYLFIFLFHWTVRCPFLFSFFLFFFFFFRTVAFFFFFFFCFFFFHWAGLLPFFFPGLSPLFLFPFFLFSRAWLASFFLFLFFFSLQ